MAIYLIETMGLLPDFRLLRSSFEGIRNLLPDRYLHVCNYFLPEMQYLKRAENSFEGAS